MFLEGTMDSIIIIIKLMLYREIIAVCSEHKVELLHIKPGGT